MRHKDLKGAIPNETAALAANSQTWYKTKLQKNYIISIIFFLKKIILKYSLSSNLENVKPVSATPITAWLVGPGHSRRPTFDSRVHTNTGSA